MQAFTNNFCFCSAFGVAFLTLYRLPRLYRQRMVSVFSAAAAASFLHSHIIIAAASAKRVKEKSRC